MYWLFGMMNQNWLVKFGTWAIQLAFKLHLPIKWLVKQTVFAHFCGGENIEDCQKSLEKLAKYRVGAILDYSVEGEKNEKGFELTTQETLRTIEKAALNKDKIPFSVFKVTGIAPFALLEKIQAQETLTESEQKDWSNARRRVDMICKRAFDRKVRIFIDAEESWIQQTIDNLAYEMMEAYNITEPIVYNTYQMYCHASLKNLERAYQDAVDKNYFLGAKLVRGAYMEKERARAEEKGYPDPIQPNKAASDRDFDAALRFCVLHHRRIALCAGTHNEQSSILLTQLMEENQIAPQNPNFYFAQLYGMSDHISYNLANAGFNVAKYVPYGPVKAVLPYLFRRAAENTAVAGQSSREFGLIQAEIRRRKRVK
jgi:proline dehydrogenase